MDNNFGSSCEIKIDLIDLAWKLLMQWKAIIIVCLSMSLLVSGVKYYTDISNYKAVISEQKKAEEQESKPADEHINDMLDTLPLDQRDAVMYLVQQQDMINVQKEYLENSILLNTNPTSQRQLTLNYLLKSDDYLNMRTLADAYGSHLHRTDIVEKLREVISPDIRPEYIVELIIDDEKESIAPESTNSTVYTVSVVLPENVDADSVASVIDSEFNSYQNELNSVVGEHSCSLIDMDVRDVFNEKALSRRASLISSINSLMTSSENALSKLTDQQRNVYDSIIAIKQSSNNSETAEHPLKESSSDSLQVPVFSRKYAVLGFFLGAFLYAAFYVVLLILRKNITSANTAQSYTGARLIGELYRTSEHRGIKKLFTSSLITKWRYHNKLNTDKQLQNLAETVDAICSHRRVDSLALVLCRIGPGFDEQIRHIKELCSSTRTDRDIYIVDTDDSGEKSLLSVKEAALVVSNLSQADDLCNLMSLVNDYDVSPIGTIYLEKL